MAQPSNRRKMLTLTLSLCLAAAALPTTAALAHYTPGIPAAVDPGTPNFAGSANPVPAEPASFDPTRNMLQAIFDADVAAGGTSYWFDRILARPFLSGDSTALYTRGRGLYMYTHTPGTLGFAGGYAYRERPTGSGCGSSSSVRPRRTVSGETATASATIPTPPGPSSRASLPSQIRR